MKNKTVSFQSGAVLQGLHAENMLCFKIEEVQRIIPGISKTATRELVRDMARRGLLMRVKKGHYYIIPFEQNAETFVPDWHLLATCLSMGANHYIGYYSALQLHNLITQPALNELIVVDRQIKPANVIIKDVSFQFVFHNKKHFFGARKIWIDSYNQVLCSDLEKTFVDCLFNPKYGGGIIETAKALYKCRRNINYEKLLEYCKKFGSQAVIKRLGFLLELLKIDNPVTDKLQEIRSGTYILLDTEMPREGKRLSRWRIQQNVDAETIQSSLLT